MERIVQQVEFRTPKKIKLLRVAAYARVSNGKDAMLHSLSAQVSYYTDYIQKRSDWEFVGVYTDEGISATNTRHRDGFNHMIADALDGKIDLIVTKSVSRFARNTVDSLTTVRKLKEKGVEVYFEKENIYTLDSKGELLITIMSSLAQEESRSISENVTWGQRKRMADGKVSLPYNRFLGYRTVEDGLPEIVPEEAEIIRLIYRSFMEGLTTNKIAQMLMEQEVPAPGGQKKWYSRKIESILTNEKYKGSALLQKKFTVDFLTKKTKINEGEAPQYFVEHTHPPIVDPEEFDMVQAKIARRLSRKELLDGMLVYIQDQYTHSPRQNPDSVRGMVRELETADLALVQFDEKLWRIMVENVTVGLDGEMVFRFRNGMEVTVE